MREADIHKPHTSTSTGHVKATSSLRAARPCLTSIQRDPTRNTVRQSSSTTDTHSPAATVTSSREYLPLTTDPLTCPTRGHVTSDPGHPHVTRGHITSQTWDVHTAYETTSGNRAGTSTPHTRPRHLTRGHVTSQAWTLPVPFLTCPASHSPSQHHRAGRGLCPRRAGRPGQSPAAAAQGTAARTSPARPCMSSTPTRPWGAGGGMDAARGRCAAPSPCPPRLGAWAHSRKARLPSAQRRGAGQPWPCAESPWDSSLFALCPRACPGTVCSDPTTVLGRAGQEQPEGQLGTQDEVKASFRSPAWPGQAGGAREQRARGSGWHQQTRVCRQGSRGPGPGVQDAASSCSRACGRQGPTWVPAVLPEHVGLHAVLGGKEPVAAGHRTPALWGSHILQVLLGMDVEAAPRRESGTAPWGERTAV